MKIKKCCLIASLVLIIGLMGCSAKPDGTETFTLVQLAQYDGKNGNKAYVAIDGKVYDVTDKSAWKAGFHQGNQAGVDLSDIISQSPHGKGILNGLTIVGTLE